MAGPDWTSGDRQKILVATDLSARSDRALDRAAFLAGHWQVPLVVLNVIETTGAPGQAEPLPSWKQPTDRVNAARKTIAADLGNIAVKTTIIVEEGDPVDAIMRTAEKENCGLIVIGTARNEFLAMLGLGRTVDGLIRHSHVPLLVVKKRARETYRNVVVATDFSESSRHALEAAIRFFPRQPLTVFHAYEPPMSGLMSDPDAYRREYRAVAEQDCAAFLKGTELLKGERQSPHVLIECGPPGQLLREYVNDKAVDLVVLGSHGRSAVFDVLIGSVAKQLLDDLPCDALVIREPRAP